MIETMADRLPERYRARHRREACADIGQHGLAAALAHAIARGEVHVDLVHVHALGMLIEFGSARAAAHGHHLRHSADQSLGLRTHALGIRQRNAGGEQQRHQRRSFVEIRQEALRQLHGANHGKQDREPRGPQHHRPLRQSPVQQLRVRSLQPLH